MWRALADAISDSFRVLERAASVAPDLRESPIVLSRDAFVDVLINGALHANGMPRFKHFSDREVDVFVDDKLFLN